MSSNGQPAASQQGATGGQQPATGANAQYNGQGYDYSAYYAQQGGYQGASPYGQYPGQYPQNYNYNSYYYQGAGYGEAPGAQGQAAAAQGQGAAGTLAMSTRLPALRSASPRRPTFFSNLQRLVRPLRRSPEPRV